MELILISKSKLKIMLDESDMREYNIGEETDCAHAETRKAIRSILDKAKDSIGFNTEGEEIFVQLYASKSGGCELFVTKGNSFDTYRSEDKKSAKRNGIQKKNEIIQKVQDSAPVYHEQATKHSRGMAFSFDHIQDMINVCKLLNKKNYRGESLAYTDNTGKYYLLLPNTDIKAYSRLDDLTFILEYGEREKDDVISAYIAEYGKVICEDGAIATLSDF